MTDYKGLTSKRLCCKCRKEKADSNQQICEELKQYRALEERLERMFGGSLPLEKYVDVLEAVLTEPDSPYRMNARILTYAESAKWDEYCRLEEQGLLLRAKAGIGDKAYHVIVDRCHDPIVYISEHEIKYVLAYGVYFADQWWTKEDMKNCDVFLDKSEAEERLRELEEKKSG